MGKLLEMIDNAFPWFGHMVDLGGNILLVIIVLAAFLWALIIERFIYLYAIYPSGAQRASAAWLARGERRSWYAQKFRQYLLYRARQSLQRNLGLVKTLIKLCPLLGLLGTVLGMLEIFDAVAITGGNNPRATAGGVSKAIITTMAGMVVAISGLPVVGYLSRKADEKRQSLSEQLPLDG